MDPKQNNDMNVKGNDKGEEQTERERDGRGRGCESSQDALHTCMTLSTNNLTKMQKRFLSRKRQCIDSADAGLSEDSGHSLLIDICSLEKMSQPTAESEGNEPY